MVTHYLLDIILSFVFISRSFILSLRWCLDSLNDRHFVREKKTFWSISLPWIVVRLWTHWSHCFSFVVIFISPKAHIAKNFLSLYHFCPASMTLIDRPLTAMDSLPNEILLEIFKYLPGGDCRRLAATCSRFHDLLPTVLDRLNVGLLVIRTERNCPPIDFFKANLSHNITQIRVNVEDFGFEFAQKLKAIVEASPNLQILKFEAPFSSKDLRPAADLLNEFVPSLSIKELHAGCFDGYLNLPPLVEKCTISANFFDDSRAMNQESRAMRSLVTVIYLLKA